MKQAVMIFIVVWLTPVACVSPGDPSSGLCGNGDLNFGEACDGDLFRRDAPFTCLQLGYNSPGRARCGADCQIDPTPCLDSGMCGDGFATPFWEACDGKDNGGETCASLGFHGGRLFCRDNCQFDISQCERCGDGVVQPQYGELMESGTQYCLDAGWFGGAMYSTNCVTPNEDRCGDYALLTPAGSATRPVVTLLPAGSVRVLARDTGSYPGFQDPRGWCPALAQVYDLSTDPPRVVAWRHDPICEREILAVRPHDAVEQILYQREEDAPVVRQVDLGAGGRVLLRQAARSLRLDRVDPEGRTVLSSRLEMTARYLAPQLQTLPGANVGASSLTLIGVSALEPDGLWLMVYEPGSGAVRSLGLLPRVSVGGDDYQLDPIMGHRLAWVSPREWWLLARLVPVAGGTEGPALLRVLLTDDGRFEVSRAIRLVGLPLYWWPPNLTLRLAEDRLEMTWAIYDVGGTRVSRTVFSTGGANLGSWSAGLTPDARVEALFVEADGSVVLAGVGPGWTAESPDGQRCRPAETSLFRWRLDPQLGSLQTRSFRTTAARWDFSSAPDFCSMWARSYDYRDGTLVVAGAYPRREGFCSDRDRPPLEKTLPVHTCGIYLVKFE